MDVVVNHLGQCVADADRSRAFYEAVFGFGFWHEITLPDRPLATLVGLEPPLGVRAVYLRRGDFVLELIEYVDAPPEPPTRPRRMNDAGLTHLSLAVADLAEARDAVRAHGGEVLDDTDVGMAVMVRDPDGQLIELLPVAYREHLPPWPPAG